MMLHTFVEAEESYANYLRPAIYDSLRSMLKYYGVDSTAQIFYNGENEIAKLVGSDSTDGPRSDIYTDGIFRNKLFIVPDIQPHAFNSGYGNQRRSLTERPVFYNEELEIMITPAFEGRRISVEVNAHFTDRISAQRFVNRINRLQANQIADMAFSPIVHLPVAKGILAYLEHVHELLVKNKATTDEVGDWFGKSCKVPFTSVTNVAGRNGELVVPMKLNNIGIQFEDAQIKLAQKGDVVGKYEVALTYFFYFQEFIGWELEYPLNIYQDQIDEKYIPTQNEEYERGFQGRQNVELALGMQLTSYDRTAHSPYFLCLPKHDLYRVEPLKYCVPTIQARLSVDDLMMQKLLNLDDIPGIEWNPGIKTYIKRRCAYAFSHHSTPFLFAVHSNDLLVRPEQLTMDPLGNVILNRFPTMQATHRFTLHVDMAIRDYNSDFWDDMLRHPLDWPILAGLFPWYDWTDWDKKFPQCIDDISIGGEFIADWSRLMMYMGLFAHNQGQ